MFSNRKRRHSTLAYHFPAEYEAGMAVAVPECPWNWGKVRPCLKISLLEFGSETPEIVSHPSFEVPTLQTICYGSEELLSPPA